MDELSRSFAVKSNDMMLVIYLSSMVRSVLALHDLIDNREGVLRSVLHMLYVPCIPVTPAGCSVQIAIRKALAAGIVQNTSVRHRSIKPSA